MARASKPKVKIDKYNRNQAPIHPITWITIASIFVVILGIIIIFSPNNQERIYNAYVANGVTTLPKDHPLKQVTYNGGLFQKGLKKIIEQEEVVILYIGYPQCPGCQSHITPVATYFKSTGMDDYTDYVYYIDVVNDTKGFETLRSNYSLIQTATPQIALFINGELVDIYNAAISNPTTTQQINAAISGFYTKAIGLINQ